MVSVYSEVVFLYRWSLYTVRWSLYVVWILIHIDYIYRVCPPGDFCTSSFYTVPELHHFPLGSKDRGSSIGLYVSVSTLPRQTVPVVPCPSHVQDPTEGTPFEEKTTEKYTGQVKQFRNVNRFLQLGFIL